MNGLGVAITIMLAASLFLSLATARATRSLSGRALDMCMGVCVALLLVFLYGLQDGVILARWIESSAVPVYAQWVPLFVGAMVGLIWQRLKEANARRVVAIIALASVALYAAYGDLLRERPRIVADVWNNDVCVQTTPYSCSAAAAVTFLKQYGIEATEREMSGLSLTSTRGTSFLGLVRGLRLKTVDSRWIVQPFSCDSEAALREVTHGRPAILWVELRDGSDVDPRYARDWGWVPGRAHAVVLFAFIGEDRVEMGDPAVGRELWSVRAIRDLWRGAGVVLKERRDG